MPPQFKSIYHLAERDRLQHLTNLSFTEIDKFAAILKVSPTILAFILYLMKNASTWDTLTVIWEKVFEQNYVCEKTLRNYVNKALAQMSGNINFDTNIRHHVKCPAFPHVTTMVDCTPVPIRGNADTHNTKYFKKVRKYQVMSDISGVPLDVRPCPRCRTHDARVLKELGTIDLEKDELILGDKAYVGNRRVVVPYKNSKKNPLKDVEMNFNTFHSLVRAKIEHVFALLKSRYSLFGFSPYSYPLTDKLVRLAYFILHIQQKEKFRIVAFAEDDNGSSQPPLPRFIEVRDDDPPPGRMEQKCQSKPPCTDKAPCGKCEREWAAIWVFLRGEGISSA